MRTCILPFLILTIACEWKLDCSRVAHDDSRRQVRDSRAAFYAQALRSIYEHSREAGPDETFFLVGENLTKDVIAWGQSADERDGSGVAATRALPDGQLPGGDLARRVRPTGRLSSG